MTAVRLLRSDAHASLHRLAAHLGEEPLLQRSFGAWLSRTPPPDEAIRMIESGPLPRNYQCVAIAALAEADGWPSDGSALDEGLDWLSKVTLDRVGIPAPLTIDAIAQIALALAVKRRVHLTSWFKQVLAHAAERQDPAWASNGALAVLGLDGASKGDATLRLALEAVGVGNARQGDDQEVLRLVMQEALPREPLRAAVLLCALDWIGPGIPSTAPLGNVLPTEPSQPRRLPVTTLSGGQNYRLTNALVRAFRTDTKLAMMTEWGMDEILAGIAGGNDLTDIAFNLVGWAQAHDRVGELLLAARAARPRNPDLFRLAQELGLALHVSEEFERLVRKDHGIVDFSRLGEIEYQVCQIDAAGFIGTGFLVGPNLIMTNYHVIEDVISGKVRPERVIVRFDYKRIPRQRAVNGGTEHRLAQTWLVDASPPSPQDQVLLLQKGTVEPGHLDYALLRVEGAPGEEAVGGQSDPGAPKRGWMFGTTSILPEGDPLIIVQHPKGDPLGIAFGSIKQQNGNQTRVYYTSNTEPGSSGSPCLNAKLELVAVHHSGDPNFFKDADYNEGIPWVRIVDRLKSNGVMLVAP